MQSFQASLAQLRGDYRQNTHGLTSWPRFLFLSFFSLRLIWAWLFWFRMAKVNNPLIGWPARLFHKMISMRLKIAISWRTEIGEGLCLGDGMCMVINPATRIGRNCNLSQFINIGTNHDTPAVIGDYVYIGPMTCIVEDVKIGDNVTIGAGSVVTRDIPACATAAGSPARVLNYHNPGRYVWHTDKFGV